MFATTLIWAAPSPTPTQSYDINGPLKTAASAAKGIGGAIRTEVSRIGTNTGASKHLGWLETWIKHITANEIRFAVCVVVAGILASMLAMKGPKAVRVAGFIAGFTGFGIATWYVYNRATGRNESLFSTAPSVDTVNSSLQSNNSAVFWIAASFLILGLVAVVATKKHLVVKLLVGYAVFAGGTTLGILVLNGWHSFFG